MPLSSKWAVLGKMGGGLAGNEGLLDLLDALFEKGEFWD